MVFMSNSGAMTPQNIMVSQGLKKKPAVPLGIAE